MAGRKPDYWDPSKGPYSKYLMDTGSPEASLYMQKGEKRTQETAMKNQKAMRKKALEKLRSSR